MSGSTSEGVTAELYVRSLAPRGVRPKQEAVIDSLEQLTDGGPLDGYTVHVCGKQAPATPADATTEFGTFLLNRVAVFTQWAEMNDASLGSLFQRRTVDSELTGEHGEVLDLPVMALAEYEGSALRFVTPCSGPEREWTVQQRLHALERTAEPDTSDRLPGARATPPASSRADLSVTSPQP